MKKEIISYIEEILRQKTAWAYQLDKDDYITDIIINNNGQMTVYVHWTYPLTKEEYNQYQEETGIESVDFLELEEYWSEEGWYILPYSLSKRIAEEIKIPQQFFREWDY